MYKRDVTVRSWRTSLRMGPGPRCVVQGDVDGTVDWVDDQGDDG